MNYVVKKIENKNVKVGIIGLGYVGLPLSISFSNAGYYTIGFDIDSEKVKKINKGESYLKHVNSNEVAYAIGIGELTSTTDFSLVQEVDIIILCLPTPLNKHKEPDLSFINNTMKSIMPFLKQGQTLCLESTTYPGTTDEVIKPLIEAQKFIIGKDFFIIYSPEREDPGNKLYNTSTIPKVLGGCTDKCVVIGNELYKNITDVVTVSSTKAAELTKLLENIYRAVNIGLVNEMKIVADKMNIDIWEVINAAATKPFGYTPFYPGPGWGGHCIPIDPFYLTWKAKEYNVNTSFIELAGDVNTKMPNWVIHKIMEALNEKEKALKNSKVLVLGLSYKKNIDDTRESPAVKLMELLRNKGAETYYSDPYISHFPNMRDHYFDLKSTEITKYNLELMDCVILATDHSDFNYDFILDHSDLLIDTRGVYKKNYKKVVKA
ncbi:nucleotide sugar dehydrogenase [Pontibacillus yanchengensis]|nr:nucleotide sugar dehydrogenase [Pontibacillus yanchengensis]